MSEKDGNESWSEIRTLGREGPESHTEGNWEPDESWVERHGEAETMDRPSGRTGPETGIVDDGRTDVARRWRAGEVILVRYVVEGELGQGGMGVVYGCLDKVGGVRVAVKCLPPELGHNSVEMEEVRENFQLVYGLSHPNIAGVRQLERDGKGEYYLVMELAEGENLRRWLRRKWKAGGVSLPEAVAVLRQVASALDYAHGMKVVHRDVKPGNVMIDGNGRVKVLDFGLAAQIRTSLSRASHAYRGTSGTGPYMAPEQWRAQPQDAKTDQYALGVMAYEMLGGRLPFENPELAVLKDAVLNGEVAGIPGVPVGAMGAIRQAMAKRAEERFESCGEFVEALEGKGMTGGAGGRRSVRGRALMGWAVALAVLAGAIGVGVWWKGQGKETAGGTPAPPVVAQPTPEEEEAERKAAEEAEKQSLAEQKAEEEAARQAAAAAEKAAHEAAEKLEEAATEEDDGAKWRAEQDAIAAARTSIDILQTHARGAVGKLEEYRKSPDGLAAHISAAEDAANQLEAVQAPMTGAEAESCIAAARAASGKLTEELGWLEQNKSARDAAANVEHEIASTLDGLLATYEAAKGAKAKYRDGTKAREAGNEALSAGRFGEAETKLKEAKALLAEALGEARADHAQRLVGSAKAYAKEKMWEKCLATVEAALDAEPGNVEAQRLKAEAMDKPAGMAGEDIRQQRTEEGLGPSLPPDLSGIHALVDASSLRQTPQQAWARSIAFRDRIVAAETGNPILLDKRKYFPIELQSAGTAWVREDMHAAFLMLPRDAEYTFGGTVDMNFRGFYLILDAAYRVETLPDQKRHWIDVLKNQSTSNLWDNREETERSEKARGPGVTGTSVTREEVNEPKVDEVFPLDLGNGVRLEMVHCPGVAADFWMGKYEVTQEQWRQIMGGNPSHFGNTPKNPVENVSWNDCQEFVKRVNELPSARASGLVFRLPTAEEWKTACRAGAPESADYGKLMHGTQLAEKNLWQVARYGENWGNGPVAVGCFLPNAWGLFDMYGNVWEWTETAVDNHRVSCGGSFYSTAADCTAGYQNRSDPDLGTRDLGLRLAASGRRATW